MAGNAAARTATRARALFRLIGRSLRSMAHRRNLEDGLSIRIGRTADAGSATECHRVPTQRKAGPPARLLPQRIRRRAGLRRRSPRLFAVAGALGERDAGSQRRRPEADQPIEPRASSARMSAWISSPRIVRPSMLARRPDRARDALALPHAPP